MATEVNKYEPVETGYYDILGVKPDADDEALRKQYRVMAMKYHPDRHPEDGGEMFKEISKIYTVLSNPARRQLYDLKGEKALAQTKSKCCAKESGDIETLTDEEEEDEDDLDYDSDDEEYANMMMQMQIMKQMGYTFGPNGYSFGPAMQSFGANMYAPACACCCGDAEHEASGVLHAPRPCGPEDSDSEDYSDEEEEEPEEDCGEVQILEPGEVRPLPGGGYSRPAPGGGGFKRPAPVAAVAPMAGGDHEELGVPRKKPRQEESHEDHHDSHHAEHDSHHGEKEGHGGHGGHGGHDDHGHDHAPSIYPDWLKPWVKQNPQYDQQQPATLHGTSTTIQPVNTGHGHGH